MGLFPKAALPGVLELTKKLEKRVAVHGRWRG
jgi:hypothetical protein